MLPQVYAPVNASSATKNLKIAIIICLTYLITHAESPRLAHCAKKFSSLSFQTKRTVAVQPCMERLVHSVRSNEKKLQPSREEENRQSNEKERKWKASEPHIGDHSSVLLFSQARPSGHPKHLAVITLSPSPECLIKYSPEPPE